MKRQDNNPVDASIQRIRWKKTGGGSLRLMNGRIIKPGEIFTASLSEVPEAFRNVITRLDGEAPIQPVKPVKTIFLKRENEDEPGMFDVVRERVDSRTKEKTYKALNTEPLTEEKADELLKNLQ